MIDIRDVDLSAIQEEARRLRRMLRIYEEPVDAEVIDFYHSVIAARIPWLHYTHTAEYIMTARHLAYTAQAGGQHDDELASLLASIHVDDADDDVQEYEYHE